MVLQFKIKRFQELSVTELYQLLQLRNEVFVVEQNCVYQDIDGKDEKALHLLGISDGKVTAYARMFRPGDYFDQASIGRVVVQQEYRHKKWGHDLMQEAIRAVEVYFEVKTISISAQLYLKKFYENLGFIQTGDTYLEDGIPHIEMKRG